MPGWNYIETRQHYEYIFLTDLVELFSYGEKNIYYIQTTNGDNSSKNLGLNTGTIIHNDLPQDYLQLLERVKKLENDVTNLKIINEALQKEVNYQTEIIGMLKEKKK